MKSALSVFQYQDYRSYLEAEYRWQKQNNPKFSLRYFAMRAQIRSYTSLKYVIEKKRHLSFGLLDRFSKALELNSSEAEYFQMLWQFETTGAASQKAKIRNQIEQLRSRRNVDSSHALTALTQGLLYYEKCQLEESRAELKKAYLLSLEKSEHSTTFEALAGLIQIAMDLDQKDELLEAEKRLQETLRLLFEQAPPPHYWNCLAKIAKARHRVRLSQRYLLEFLRSARSFESSSAEATAWAELTKIQCDRKLWKRAQLLCNALLEKYKDGAPRGIRGSILMSMGLAMESKRDFLLSQVYYEKAQSEFREERNWHASLFTQLSFARICRKMGDQVRAQVYLKIAQDSAPTELNALTVALEKERRTEKKASR